MPSADAGAKDAESNVVNVDEPMMFGTAETFLAFFRSHPERLQDRHVLVGKVTEYDSERVENGVAITSFDYAIVRVVELLPTKAPPPAAPFRTEFPVVDMTDVQLVGGGEGIVPAKEWWSLFKRANVGKTFVFVASLPMEKSFAETSGFVPKRVLDRFGRKTPGITAVFPITSLDEFRAFVAK